MKIYDCFTYCGEDLLLDIRLKTLNESVDKFVIVEGNRYFNGDKKPKLFNIEKFKSFESKIDYYFIQDYPVYNGNNWDYEYFQRNKIELGLNDLEDNDIILISDVDEIPNLEKIDFNKFQEKIIQFRQDMFYYKFNLKLPNLIWTGTKGCKKKDLITPQWLRNIKDKKYPLFRIDTILSKTKYISVKFIDDGGWHFSNIKSAKEIEHKLKSYLHHREFDINPLNTDEIENIIKNKQAIYDLKVDKRVNKIGNGSKLENYPTNKLPIYLQKNKKKYEQWID